MRMLSLVSGWYPHTIERPNDRLGLNTTLNGLMTDWG